MLPKTLSDLSTPTSLNRYPPWVQALRSPVQALASAQAAAPRLHVAAIFGGLERALDAKLVGGHALPSAPRGRRA